MAETLGNEPNRNTQAAIEPDVRQNTISCGSFSELPLQSALEEDEGFAESR
jgi:hypothetical protein